MGFFDRFTAKKPTAQPAAPTHAAAPVPAPEPVVEKPAAAGGVMPRLAAARAKLAARDLAGAMAIYEEVLAVAGDRADVLLTTSADLGVHGHVRELVQLIAPRYAADRHGPGPGINLLQAYLAVRDPESAQHLLDLLFSLNKPDLEERLIGFSRVIAELSVSDNAPAEMSPGGEERRSISLVSISKPIWFYGLEESAAALLPRKEGRLRRVAFAQCALLGEPNALERAARPEDEHGRFTRGLALWLAETFHAGAGYEAFAGIGTFAPEHYALFPAEWSAENVRQLHETTQGGLDYVLTGALKARNDDYELTLRIWEVKKFRELKAFTTRWTPGNREAVLAQFHQQVRTYMEWTALPGGNGLAYAAPAAPHAHLQALGASLGLFLAEKGVISAAQAPQDAGLFLANAQANPADARAQLLLVTALQRLQARGAAADLAALAHARAWLASDAAKAAGATGIAL